MTLNDVLKGFFNAEDIKELCKYDKDYVLAEIHSTHEATHEDEKFTLENLTEEEFENLIKFFSLLDDSYKRKHVKKILKSDFEPTQEEWLKTKNYLKNNIFKEALNEIKEPTT